LRFRGRQLTNQSVREVCDGGAPVGVSSVRYNLKAFRTGFTDSGRQSQKRLRVFWSHLLSKYTHTVATAKIMFQSIIMWRHNWRNAANDSSLQPVDPIVLSKTNVLINPTFQTQKRARQKYIIMVLSALILVVQNRKNVIVSRNKKSISVTNETF